MFVVMFAEMPDFGKQEHLFAEAVSQIASASLLPRQLGGLALFKAEFLRHVQHQLRTPLRSALETVDHLRNAIDQMRGGAGDVSLDLSADGTLATLLDSIAASARTLNAYFNDLLSFQSLSSNSSKSPLRPSAHVPVDIVSVIEAIADEEWKHAQRLLLPSAQPSGSEADATDQNESCSVELIVRCAPELRQSQWVLDSRTLQAAVRMVIATAAHFTRSGYVEVIARLAEGRSFHVSKAQADGGDCSFSVEIEVLSTSNRSTAQDTATSGLAHPFGIKDAFHDGPGLSMAIVSSMLKSSGGHLSVFTGVGGKNAMAMRLPAERGPALASSSSFSAGKFAVKSVAFYGMHTEGLQRLATCIWEHLSTVGKFALTENYHDVDCIILPESIASDANQRWATMLSQARRDSRFVLIRSSYLVHHKQIDSLSGRATLPLALPHGPNSFWLLETFLSDDEPMPIYTTESTQKAGIVLNLDGH